MESAIFLSQTLKNDKNRLRAHNQFGHSASTDSTKNYKKMYAKTMIDNCKTNNVSRVLPSLILPFKWSNTSRVKKVDFELFIIATV